jgi:hypothetical protein
MPSQIARLLPRAPRLTGHAIAMRMAPAGVGVSEARGEHGQGAAVTRVRHDSRMGDSCSKEVTACKPPCRPRCDVPAAACTGVACCCATGQHTGHSDCQRLLGPMLVCAAAAATAACPLSNAKTHIALVA